MDNQPTYFLGDKEIVVKFIKELILMNWNYNGLFKLFKSGNLYSIPTFIALELSKQGYCYYIEGIK